MSNGENLAGDGHPITIRGTVFAKGLGTHAAADIRYNLGGSCSAFNATLGLDDEVAGSAGSVTYQVWGDGVKLYDSGFLNTASAMVSASVNVGGKNQLQLVVTDGGDGNTSDHADWANAQITCSAVIGPVVTSTSPVNGSTAVPVTTGVTATFAAAVDPTTITPTTFTLVKQGTTTVLPATVSYNNANTTASLQPGASLDPSATYTATLKGGSSGVKDTAGTAMGADQVWTFTTAGSSGETYLSDHTWTSMTNGYGPVELDMSNGENLAGDGHTITIRGATFAKGLGAHANSDVRYSVGGSCSLFAGTVGIDDEVPTGTGSVVFQVWADSVKLYDSGVLTRASAGFRSAWISAAKMNWNWWLQMRATARIMITPTGLPRASPVPPTPLPSPPSPALRLRSCGR